MMRLYSSVLICDEQKFSADNIDNTNTIPTSIIIKQTKKYNRSDTWIETYKVYLSLYSYSNILIA